MTVGKTSLTTAQQQTEAAFLRISSAAGARASSKVIDERSRYAGTPGDYRLAVYMHNAMRADGLKAWIEPFPSTVYTPHILQLQLLTSPAVTFDLHEQKIPVDPDGTRPDRAELRKGCVAYINSDEAVREVLGIANPPLDTPSGGSDFEAFVYTIGTPVSDLGYAGPLGTYHLPYDDYRFASLYADPGFVHHRTVA
jgi:hypothetical protein